MEIRWLYVVSLVGIKAVLMGPEVVLKKVSCYKSKADWPLKSLYLPVWQCDLSLSLSLSHMCSCYFDAHTPLGPQQMPGSIPLNLQPQYFISTSLRSHDGNKKHGHVVTKFCILDMHLAAELFLLVALSWYWKEIVYTNSVFISINIVSNHLHLYKPNISSYWHLQL